MTDRERTGMLPAGGALAGRDSSSWATVLRHLKRHRLGLLGGWTLIALYTVTLFSPFLAPYEITRQHRGFENASPMPIRIIHEGGVRAPFVYPLAPGRDPVTFRRTFREDRANPVPLRLLARGDRYYLLGFLTISRTDLHLFGTADGAPVLLFGGDKLGRDLFSRTLVGARVSMTVGLVGVIIAFSIGILMGGISGYFGGRIDQAIQRVGEIFLSFPRLPILLALAAAIPPRWSPSLIYVGIVAVLALIGWAGLARVVRGQFLAAREQEYVQAARSLGAGNLRIILRHILPNTMSYIVVAATGALPGFMLGEAALSFLGLGVREPAASWGLLLRDAIATEVLRLYPWQLLPGAFIVVAALAFYFFGDALRDAVDPRQASGGRVG